MIKIKGVLVGTIDHWIPGSQWLLKGEGHATSHPELRSDINLTLNLTNGETVSHHYSYDRQAEKEKGSPRKTTKTQKILGQAVAIPGRA